ncbi:hypothetical protein, partial [Pseudomonas sp. SIMBA_067]|uniref:hypothetical protein n=1 Tax=Pseudomonas sp. SIMBA_067 TaxID=3085807 RepID=UPI003977F29C
LLSLQLLTLLLNLLLLLLLLNLLLLTLQLLQLLLMLQCLLTLRRRLFVPRHFVELRRLLTHIRLHLLKQLALLVGQLCLRLHFATRRGFD